MVDGLKPYTEYRSSGLPWAENIPGHWEVRRNSRLFAERNETGFPDLPILEVSIRTGVTIRDLENGKRKQMMTDRAQYKRAVRGDIAYNMMRMWQGAVGTAPVDGLVSPAYVVARPFPDLNSRYYSYLFRTRAYMNEVNKFSRGIVTDRNRLYWDEFRQMPSLFPPREEQNAIAIFLDGHTELVAKFVRTKRRQLDLLNQQKQAIVHRVLTTGLNRADSRKRSGISWLQEVPQHWAVLPLQRRYSVELGKMLDAKRITGKYLVPYLRNTDVQWDRINCADLPTMDIDPQEYDRYTVRPGDLLVCEGGDVGRCAFWEGRLPLCGYQKALHRLRPNDGTLDNPRYLFYLMYIASKQGVFRADGSENTIAHLTREKLCRHRFAFPPRMEQDAICAMLADELQNIDAAMANAGRQIDLIREHHDLLVSSTVVGKFDVRVLALETRPEPDIDLSMLEDVEVAEADDDALVEVPVGDK